MCDVAGPNVRLAAYSWTSWAGSKGRDAFCGDNQSDAEHGRRLAPEQHIPDRRARPNSRSRSTMSAIQDDGSQSLRAMPQLSARQGTRATSSAEGEWQEMKQ